MGKFARWAAAASFLVVWAVLIIGVLTAFDNLIAATALGAVVGWLIAFAGLFCLAVLAAGAALGTLA